MSLERSTEMFSLLVEFGADAWTKDPERGSTLYQDALVYMPKTFDMLEAALETVRIDENFGENLHGLLNAVFALQPEHRLDIIDTFRYILCKPGTIKYLDTLDKNGLTMVQKAAYMLHLESLKLLLDAGVDANVPYVCATDNVNLLPLQIVCAWGRLLWWGYKENVESQAGPRQRLNRERAFKVAAELLEWHRVRPDNPFKGITRLHLAHCIGDDAEVGRLIAAGFGEDQNVKGCWPGIEREVLPADLIEESFENEIVALGCLRVLDIGSTAETTRLWG
ncbi:hypothetical protein P171DRAFT_430848 [Karstenula rhodostoma CBS 690.94]|uniref:Ankyrin n=1 Tax=Karstenula rhodostoma CBS 690.94 TaxID=1392251 RepID=A0A9P4PLP3_9PLEO|nr:hypothetical protein P171DRAFT_430848 [Karstenula rhodostoma CBS 690.94]